MASNTGIREHINKYRKTIFSSRTINGTLISWFWILYYKMQFLFRKRVIFTLVFSQKGYIWTSIYFFNIIPFNSTLGPYLLVYFQKESYLLLWCWVLMTSVYLSFSSNSKCHTCPYYHLLWKNRKKKKTRGGGWGWANCINNILCSINCQF